MARAGIKCECCGKKHLKFSAYQSCKHKYNKSVHKKYKASVK